MTTLDLIADLSNITSQYGNIPVRVNDANIEVPILGTVIAGDRLPDGSIAPYVIFYHIGD